MLCDLFACASQCKIALPNLIGLTLSTASGACCLVFSTYLPLGNFDQTPLSKRINAMAASGAAKCASPSLKFTVAFCNWPLASSRRTAFNLL